MVLFTITCTTCKAKLKVRDEAAIGQILGCPKCGSMVHVAAPEGWKPPQPAVGTQRPQDDSDRSNDAKLDSAVSVKGGKRRQTRWRDEVVVPGEAIAIDDEAVVNAAEDVAEARNPVVAPDRQPSAAWIKWGLWAGGTLVGASLLVGAWFSWGRSRAELPLPLEPEVEAPHAEASWAEPAPAVGQESAPLRLSLDPRWLPSAAEGVLSIQPSGIQRQPEGRLLLGRTSTLWNPAFATLFAAFQFAPADIRRLTWATTDLAAARGYDWLAAGLVIVEVDRPIAERNEWLDGCDSLDWKLGEFVCRSVPASDWPHPFAVVGERTIVTGPAEAMKVLSDRGGPRTARTEFEHLVDRLEAGGDLLWALDLAAVRAVDAMPAWLPLIEVCHAEHDDWQVVRELPKAVGLGLRLDERLQIELLFACDGDSSAEQLEQALGRVVSAVEKTLIGESEVLATKLRADELTTADAGQLKLLFSATRESLKQRQFEREGAVVRLAAGWDGDWSAVALAAVASVPELESSRLSTARVLDEDHHRQLLEALMGFAKAEGSFPAGAGGATLLPPENRLSWIATLLPYFGRLDWHGELTFGRPWNEANNAQVARRPFDLVINPALGPSQTKATFPVTHYVGIAGLGPDAGKLEADDSRAGLFGYNRRSTPEQIGDGASHTIAVMGVSGKLGAWAAGGEPTVRPLTARPYVNGPDGFGSGLPNGMLVGMADGSVRFISKDVAPDVLERMATINGGETTPDLTEKGELIADTDTDTDSDLEAQGDAEPPAADAVEVRPADSARPVRPEAAITARLADTIPAIEFDKVPLVDVVRMLSDFSTLEISIDVEALAEMGIKPDAQVTLRLQDASVEEVLVAALAELKLIFVVADGHVLVTKPRSPKP